MRCPGLLDATLMVPLLFQFRLETLPARGSLQVGRFQPHVHRAANLLHGEPILAIARGIVAFLTHAGTEQLAQLGYIKVSVHASPAANFVVVQSQLLFPIAETAFYRRATKGHSQQPA